VRISSTCQRFHTVYTFGCEVVSLTLYEAQEVPWYSFLLNMSRSQDRSAAGRIRPVKKTPLTSEIELANFSLVA
jgi:hypothetical protein